VECLTHHLYLYSNKTTRSTENTIQNTRNSAIADKPRDAFRLLEVSQGYKHGTIPYVRNGFLLWRYSNIIHKMRRFSDIRLPKISCSWNHESEVT